jgi:hypothetical protein
MNNNNTPLPQPVFFTEATLARTKIENEKVMLDAIKEAYEALSQLDNCRIFCADSMDIDSYATDDCANARVKLRPFIK